MRNKKDCSISSEKNKGVSEVLGTILMVGLVVILAAAAAVMIFGVEIPLINPKLTYIDVSKTDLGDTEFIVLTNMHGEKFTIGGQGNSSVKLVDPASNMINPVNAGLNPIAWDRGVSIFIYKTGGGDYEISTSRPAVAPAAFDPGIWGIIGVDGENNIVFFEDTIEF